MTAALFLPLLFALSAFFSASETALFSLRRHDLDWLRGQRTRSARSVVELLEHPRTLLVAVLFGNLLVNFLLMSLVARLAVAIGPGGSGGVLLGGVLASGAVIVLGEVTPKAVAVTLPRRVALLTGLPLLVFRNATRPVTRPLEALVNWGLDRVERRLPPAQGALTDQELRRFVELHGEQGEIEREASEFLAVALELGSRRVQEVVTPRVDLVALDLSLPDAAARAIFVQLLRDHRLGKVLVHDGGGLDRIHGYLTVRDVLTDPERPLRELVRPAWFIPRTKSLESVMREMIERNEPLAVVLGEYGGTFGLVTLEDVVEEITGDIARRGTRPLVRPGPGGTWVIIGRFPLRETGELLGIKFPVPGPTTLSGFVAQQLGRLGEVGDVVWHAGVQFKVLSVERRRAREILVTLPQPGRRPPPPRPPHSDEDEVPEEMTVSGARRASLRLARWVAESSPEEESVPRGPDGRPLAHEADPGRSARPADPGARPAGPPSPAPRADSPLDSASGPAAASPAAGSPVWPSPDQGSGAESPSDPSGAESPSDPSGAESPSEPSGAEPPSDASSAAEAPSPSPERGDDAGGRS